MSRYIATNRSNSCPVCGDTKGKCRSLSDSDLILCMDLAGTPKREKVAGYVCLGDTSDNLWSKFVPDNQEEWDEQKRREWQARRQQQAPVPQHSALSATELDKQLRAVARQRGTLATKDLEDLRRRGLSDEAIARYPFFSVDRGRNDWNRSQLPIYAQYEGYVTPAVNRQGRVIGGQVRLHLPPGEQGKYRPPGKDFPRVQVEGGCELPLTRIDPPQRHNRLPIPDNLLLHAEGILKPLITAEKYGRTTLGAISGNFTASPQQWAENLQGYEGAAIAPDAGDVKNRPVMIRWQRIVDWLRERGYSVQFVWWGQVNKGKGAPDIDELTEADISRIRLISWEEFWRIACLQLPMLAQAPNSIRARVPSKTISRDEFLRKYGLPRTLDQLCGLVKKHVLKFFKRKGELPERVELSPARSQTAIVPYRPEYCPHLHNYTAQLFQYNCHWRPYVNYLPNLADPYNPHKCKPQSWKLTYRPGHLPDYERWRAMGEPVIGFKGGDRKQLYIEAKAKGYGIVLDSSPPGYGKSHDSGTLVAEDFEANSLTYLDKNHRNVSTATVEQNFRDVAVRHPGFKYHPTHRTPSGVPHLYRVKPGETPDVLPNCTHARKFESLANKNIDIGLGSENPICQNCQVLEDCKNGRGNGFGYLYEKANSLSYSSQFRAHPRSLAALPKGNAEGEGRVAIVEEPDRLLEQTTELEVGLGDIERTILDLQQDAPPSIAAALVPWLLELRRSLKEDDSHYGLGNQELIDRLPPLELPAIAARTSTGSTAATWNALMSWPAFTTEVRRFVGDCLHSDIEDLAAKSNDEVEAIPANYLVLLLGIYQRYLSNVTLDRQQAKEYRRNRQPSATAIERATSGGIRGAVRIANKKLILTRRNYHDRNLLQNAAFQIHLDATISRQELAFSLGAKPSDILECCQEVGSDVYSNLTIKQVKGLGNCGAQRARYDEQGNKIESPTSQESRLKFLVGAIAARHAKDKRGIIDLKQHVRNWQGDDGKVGHWFHDNRGSNEFCDCNVLTIIGMPTPNLGAMAAQWQCLTGEVVDPNDKKSNPRFWAWVRQKQHKEMTQAVGRGRANLRAHQQITVYTVTEENLGFLKKAYPGARLETVEAIQICPQAAPRVQQTKLAIVEAFAQLRKRGEKVTQEAIAAIAGITQGRISQIAAEYEGWQRFRKILISLLEGLNSKTNNFEAEIPEGLRWMARVFLPLMATEGDRHPATALTELFTTFEASGAREFRQILSVTAVEIKAKLLAMMLRLLPGAIQDEILEWMVAFDPGGG